MLRANKDYGGSKRILERRKGAVQNVSERKLIMLIEDDEEQASVSCSIKSKSNKSLKLAKFTKPNIKSLKSRNLTKSINACKRKG